MDDEGQSKPGADGCGEGIDENTGAGDKEDTNRSEFTASKPLAVGLAVVGGTVAARLALTPIPQVEAQSGGDDSGDAGDSGDSSDGCDLPDAVDSGDSGGPSDPYGPE